MDDNIEKETRRTRLKAGDDLTIDSDNIEKYESMYTITQKNFVHGLSFYQSPDSHLVVVPQNDQSLIFEDGTLKFENLPFSEAKLMEWSASNKQGVEIEHFDLPLLTALYSIILNDLNDKYKNLAQIDDISVMDASVKIYVPELARIIGKTARLSKKNTEELVKRIASFNSVVGILKNKDENTNRTRESVLPVLLFLGYEESTNTIEFTSPYMTKLIQTIYHASIKRDVKGAIKYQKNGDVELNPSHSKLIKTAIVNEKNKAAVEIVMEVVKVIERAGNHTPNIKAITLIERVPQLAIRLNKIDASGVKNPRGNKNTALKRAFSKAWELLDTQTYLKDTYKDIQLPDPEDPKNIPKINTLQQVFTFPHKGKITKK